MTATDKAQIIKNAVDALGAMLPLQWHDAHGRLICILQTGIGILYCNGTIKERTDGGENPVVFKVTLDGVYPKDDDGWFVYKNPPIGVHDGTYHDEIDELTGEIRQVPNIKIDPLAAFFEFIEQAVS